MLQTSHLIKVTAPADSDRADRPTRRVLARLALVLVAAVLTLAGCFTLVGLLLTRVLADSLLSSEVQAARELEERRTPTADGLTHLIGWLAETPTVVLAAAVVALILRRVSGRWREAVFVLVAVMGQSAAFLIVTLLIDRRRPDVTHLDAAPPTSSFPSGHTGASVALYGSVAVVAWRLVSSRVLRCAVVSVAVMVPLLVAVSRLYRGMHYPSDVAGGILLGLTWLALVTWLLPPGRGHPRGMASAPAHGTAE